MAQLPLIEFEWQRDPKGYRLEGSKPGSRRIMRNGSNQQPLVACRPLTGDEYRIFANTATSPVGLLDFVECYGPLTAFGNDVTKGDYVDFFMWEASAMRQLLSAANQRRPSFPDKLFDVMATSVFTGAVVWDPATETPRWSFRPSTLRDAVWLQFGESVTRGARLRACHHCGAWFEAGVGTGRRADAKFCSDEHRIAFNSLKRSKGE